jgi:hypothetical protein
MITYDDLRPEHKFLYDKAATPKEKQNILNHAEDQYNYEASLPAKDMANKVAQNLPQTPTDYGMAAAGLGVPTFIPTAAPVDNTITRQNAINAAKQYASQQSGDVDSGVPVNAEQVQTSVPPAQVFTNTDYTPKTNPIAPNYATDVRTSSPSTAAAAATAQSKLDAALGKDFYNQNISLKPQQQSAQSSSPSFLSKLFSGEPTQTVGGAVVQRQNGPAQQGQSLAPTKLNWGSNDSDADFFRADQAMQQLKKSGENFTGVNQDNQNMKRGGEVKEKKHDPLHHALSLISHILGHKHQ